MEKIFTKKLFLFYENLQTKQQLTENDWRLT